MNIAFLQTAIERAKSGSIKGVSLVFDLTNSALNVAFVDADLSLQNGTIEVIHKSKRYGQYSPIDNMPIQDFLAGNCYRNQEFQAIRTWTTASVILVAAAAGIAEQRLLTLEVPFADIIHLEPGDDLIVTVKTAGMNANAVFSAASQVTCEFRTGIGNAKGLPFCYRKAVVASSSSFTEECMRGTERCTFVNHNQSAVLTANQVINSASVNSDKNQDTFSYAELLGMRNNKFETNTEAALRFQNFILHEGEPVNDLKVVLGLQGPNILSDKNALIVVGVRQTQETMTKHYHRANKHIERDVQKLIAEA